MKRHVPISVLVVLILMVMSSVALGIMLRKAGIDMIYCIIPIGIAVVYTVIVDKLSKIESHRREVIVRAVLDKKMSIEELSLYLVAAKYGEITKEQISIIQSALELDDPELLKKAKDIINDPELMKDARALLKDPEVVKELKKRLKKH